MEISSPPSLVQLIEQQSAYKPGPDLLALRDALLERYGDATQAMLYYGSCLRSGNAADGLVDLYVIVDDYQNAYKKHGVALLNTLLPPNVFYLEVPLTKNKIRAKYAVLTLNDFQRGTSRRWFHSYLWARFAQPVGLLYTCNNAITQQIYTHLGQAVITFLYRVIPRLPDSLTIAEIWQEGFKLTYKAELRPEKTDRAQLLFSRYESDFKTRALAAFPSLPFNITVDPADNSRYQITIPTHLSRFSRISWALRFAQGKLLSVLRLCKATLTFQGGIDYIIWKLERHSGQEIEVTPRLRRYPLIFVWGLMWRLYRRGVFR